MIRKIYQELVAIRKELQAIRSSLESRKKVDKEAIDFLVPQDKQL